MPTVALVRHAVSVANAGGILAGWSAEVGLTPAGVVQAHSTARTLTDLVPVRLVSSPLERCLETAAIIGERLGLAVDTDDGLGECHYGAWTGRPLVDLVREPEWRRVQDSPELATFPPSADYRSESLAEMAERAWGTIRRLDAQVAAAHGPGACWVAVTHGDPIKAVLAHAAGVGVAGLQRFHADPASVSMVRLPQAWERPDDADEGRSLILTVNGSSRTLGELVAQVAPPSGARAGDAVVGGAG